MGEVAPGGADQWWSMQGLVSAWLLWLRLRYRRQDKPLRVRPLAAGFWMLAAAGAAALAIWLTTAWLLDVADDAPAGTEQRRSGSTPSATAWPPVAAPAPQ
ncbi:hypothetical protein GCM10009527_092100 [Actinomadura nitritigenes]|uniref:Uncharacterized protein n=1 Tax=Actinomadura nitritigenes TaxID=134602 RepID=A0ABS3RE65_9ACTN|nr:hypothetical protein [Actinomadura nitritigenes]MBO2444520.1 hypothetical protein [Actinomadura nitritigenes]